MSAETIMIPVDGSEYSQYACDVAYKFTLKVPGRETIHLAYCVEQIPNLIGGATREELEKEYAEEAEKVFAPCRKKFTELGNPCHTHVLYGDAGERIVETAEKFGCSLIIMGAKGKNALQSIVLGSVSQHVLQHAKIPVLLVKPEQVK